ncbi:homocysteine S-methyltransferase [Cognatiyoonia koreensis]|uniref:Homocysteine S-methyltransferase n=1 Tax=Cognatiyoonia koreensis TaxID=364200 RepID=A0A1I0MJ13_9RHOB|nr:homocysteine S-methyltransferase family protein [Cognatiyoonia koreensis]SEV88327.1 homocysteine S-methyltransferase [Cognatiyoonia koreensis]
MTLLPHQSDKRFVVWTGMETDLIFNQGIDLPGFASFPLLEKEDTRLLLADYVKRQIDLAARHGIGTILESVTWMANADRARALGYNEQGLITVNRDAIGFLAEIRSEHDTSNVLISANIGPRRDAYTADQTMSPDDAESYHAAQIASLIGTEIDLLSAYTLSNSPEAIGIARAANKLSIPCVIAFTVETDGRLPSGQQLDDAIAQTDAATNTSPVYYMINCAHPDHFADKLSGNTRIRGVVVNASRCSHAELDEATQLDDGDPVELAEQVAGLLRAHPALGVFGGCCGTDLRHLDAMAKRVGAIQ